MKKSLQKEPEIVYPMRINRYLALQGHSTRRGADTLIEQKKVTINGKIAVLGDKVNKEDRVEIQNAGREKNNYVYLAYNKAPGITTTMPQPGEKAIVDLVKFRTKVFPVGRLDKESRGLIILTNDGRIIERLLSPDKTHEKEYQVVVNKPITEQFIQRLEKGIALEDFTTKPAVVEELDEKTLTITITEGKRHQIRRMCTACGYEVRDLQRIRIMNIRLGNTKEGQYRELSGKELTLFLESIGLKK
ncbi:MAG: pseudouridine synthase [Candidatus Pacebacteria bacterium]|nr:pseudouridine synthase [Candidatus Paceibacterota bacterium]